MTEYQENASPNPGSIRLKDNFLLDIQRIP